MLMSVVETAAAAGVQMPVYPELAGKRVLITGVSRHGGADLAAAFADHKARLIINFAEESAEMQALASLIAPAAMELALFHDGLASAEGITNFTRNAARIHGGLDAVINFAHLGPLGSGTAAPAMDEAALEAYVSDKLLAPCLISRIAANRMALTWSEGVVLNVVTMAPNPGAAEIAAAGVTRATLAAMTRRQAGDWAGQAVRINAIAPDVFADAGAGASTAGKAADAGITALVLYLTSRHGAALSGHVFDPGDGTSALC